VKGKLESYRLDASLNDAEFLAKLIMEYTRTSDKPSGCKISDEELSKLAGKVAGFDSGHALIARLIGEELARSNCNVGEVEKLIYNAKGKARVFITQYINKLFKVDKDPDVAKALVEVFALRRPFVDKARPSDPILTSGIVELIGKEGGAKILYGAEGKELRGWLAIRQHDLIEEAIGKLLDCVGGKGEGCEVLGDAPKPWKTIGVMETLREVSEKVRNEDSAVEYFASNYGEKLTSALKVFNNECWKRAAFIIGHVLAGRVSVPRPEDLPEDVRESIKDALDKCSVDDYLLVGNVTPPLIWYLTYTHVSTEAFIDKYNEAINEVGRVLNIVRGKGINVAERIYGLGLASIIAKAVKSGKHIEPNDADAALYIASSAIQRVVSPSLIMLILSALEPLRAETPHRYLELLAFASSIENLDSGTVRYIFDELNEILDNYGDVVKRYAWSLVHAIIAYAYLLWVHRSYFYDEVKGAVRKVADLLNELDRSKLSLGVIAWAIALAPALIHGDVKELMEKASGIDVVDKAGKVLDELSRLRGRVQELMRDEEFMSYIKSRFVKADEETVKTAILEASSHLKHALAQYRLSNDELDKAEKLSNEAAKEYREIGSYENCLIAHGLVLRVEAIRGSLVGDELVKLVNGFRQLYEETFSKEHFEPTAPYLSIALTTLGDYLVSLALTGDDKKINELLEEHLWVLNANRRVSVLTRLMLNALLRPRVGLSSELEGKLSVNPEELIDAFIFNMRSEFLPALMVAFGVKTPEDGIKLCEKFNDEDCVDFVLAVKGDSAAVKQLRELLINVFQRVLNVSLNLFKELGVDIDTVLSEFRGLVSGLDGKSLAQLIAPRSSMARLALMLHALINGDERLAKAYALMGAVNVGEKLPTRLYLEAYKACCDLESESFRRAVAKLFFLHV
jgi:hypothetical protein